MFGFRDPRKMFFIRKERGMAFLSVENPVNVFFNFMAPFVFSLERFPDKQYDVNVITFSLLAE